jgi:hypothetical protein
MVVIHARNYLDGNSNPKSDIYILVLVLLLYSIVLWLQELCEGMNIYSVVSTTIIKYSACQHYL